MISTPKCQILHYILIADAPGFLELLLSMTSVCVCVCVCVCACVHACVRACVSTQGYYVLTSGGIWTLYDWLKKFYSFCMAAVVVIISRPNPSIDAHHRNQPSMSELMLYKVLIYLTVVYNSCTYV